MLQRYMFNMVSNLARGKVKRLIKRGILEHDELYNRTMFSVYKPQVQMILKAVNLDNIVMEQGVEAIVNQELVKYRYSKKHGEVIGQKEQTA